VRIPEVLAPIEKEEFINQIIDEHNRQLLSIAREYAPPDEAICRERWGQGAWAQFDRAGEALHGEPETGNLKNSFH
jgi:hypothetical protein